MNLMLDPQFTPLGRKIGYDDRILLMGSCFTEHMHDRLAAHKFNVLGNPNGILFNPFSMAFSLDNYLSGRQYGRDDLFFLNDLWNSWDHHTRFSHTDPVRALEMINSSARQASEFIRTADYLVLTMGSAFQYYLKKDKRAVANNHRAPAQWFEKKLIGTDDIIRALSGSLDRLLQVNPGIRILFTISPVRHIRDGVIDNNRSKAQLIDAVHTLCENYANAWYFPAYEIVVDVLRDYRFYDIDLVHPNYLATEYVWEKFISLCIRPEAIPVMKEVRAITTARAHRPRFPDAPGHARFREDMERRIRTLMERHGGLDFTDELEYFRTAAG